LANVIQDIATSAVSVLPEMGIKPGAINAVGQMATQLVSDIIADQVRGRMKGAGDAQWWVERELPSLGMAAVFALLDLTPEGRRNLMNDQAAYRRFREGFSKAASTPPPMPRVGENGRLREARTGVSANPEQAALDARAAAQPNSPKPVIDFVQPVPAEPISAQSRPVVVPPAERPAAPTLSAAASDQAAATQAAPGAKAVTRPTEPPTVTPVDGKGAAASKTAEEMTVKELRKQYDDGELSGSDIYDALKAKSEKTQQEMDAVAAYERGYAEYVANGMRMENFGEEYLLKELRKTPRKEKTSTAVQELQSPDKFKGMAGYHRGVVQTALNNNRPVSSAAVDAYGIALPEGYVREADRYVFKPDRKSVV
jgi:hypothetical protein